MWKLGVLVGTACWDALSGSGAEWVLPQTSIPEPYSSTGASLGEATHGKAAALLAAEHTGLVRTSSEGLQISHLFLLPFKNYLAQLRAKPFLV